MPHGKPREREISEKRFRIRSDREPDKPGGLSTVLIIVVVFSSRARNFDEIYRLFCIKKVFLLFCMNAKFTSHENIFESMSFWLEK